MTFFFIRLKNVALEMNPYTPPATAAQNSSVSPVAVVILWIGNIGLGVVAAVLCGISCYVGIDGDGIEDTICVLILFAVPFLVFAWFGIGAGMIHLRDKSKLNPIPLPAYVFALVALISTSLYGNPIVRWTSIFAICAIISLVVAIRTAVRYQHGKLADGG